ncbi:MAG: hypothetical protein AAFO01_08830 [Pseudomonadota bacterium]
MIKSRYWSFAIATACILNMAATSSLAQDALSDRAKIDRGHWTPERILGAQSLAAPEPALSLSNLMVNTEALQFADSTVSGSGAAPSAARPKDGSRLYAVEELPRIAPDDVGDVQPLDVGSGGGYFSSSRLIPNVARLFYPYSAAGKLFFSIPGEGDFVCSAGVLRPRLILTAGHCVHSGSDGVDGFFENFLFVPAFNEGAADFLSWEAVALVVTGSWATSGNTFPNRADFAIIEMRDQVIDGTQRRIGEITGFFGFQTNALIPNHVKMLGYPQAFDGGEIMHQVDAGDFGAAAEETALYGGDMTGGSSGGPWVENFGEAALGQTGGLAFRPNRIVGVSSFGFTDEEIKLVGSSILNDEFLSILEVACARQAGNCEP